MPRRARRVAAAPAAVSPAIPGAAAEPAAAEPAGAEPGRPRKPAVALAGIYGVATTRLSEIAAREVTWLMPQWIPEASVTVLGGPSGVGKSTFLARLCAQVTARRGIIDPEDGTARAVLYYTLEEQPGMILRPRMTAARCELSLIRMPDYSPDGALARRLSLPQDLQLLRTTIYADRAALVILDPITSYLGPGIDSMKACDVRGILEALEAVAAETGATIVLTLHDRKGTTGSSISRFAGSAAWTQVPRTVIRLGHDPHTEGVHLLCAEKWLLATRPRSRTYTLESDGGPPVWTIGGESLLIADDVGGIPAGTGERDALADARDFLLSELSTGEQRTKTLQTLAQEGGLSWITVRRAKESLRVTTARIPWAGSHYTVWRLPEQGGGT
jgi:hypothetical protein